MTSTSNRLALIPGAALMVLSLSLTACGASNESDAGTGTDSGSTTTELSGELNGAGASSQEKAMEAWATGFQGLNPDVTLNYAPVGSGDGRTQFIEGGTLFAGTDSYFSDDEGELSAAKERCGGEDIVEVPAYVSPIAIIFNVEGVDSLNLDAATAAQIFDGKIKSWNDPAIAKLNPDVELPDLAITTVHRQDESGTTKNFTDYLAQAGEGAWSYPADKVWPTQSGEAASGTSGVIAAIKAGDGSIGYADESQVGDLAVASIKVGDAFVAPSADGSAKALEVSPIDDTRTEGDLAIKVDRTTTEAGAYPLMLTSYLIACPTYDGDKAELVKGFLKYIVSTEGQQEAADNAGSAPLPDSLQQKAEEIIDSISAK